MSKPFRRFGSQTLAGSLLGAGVLLLALAAGPALAANLQSAKVTQIIKDVRLLPTQAAPRPASVSDEVGTGTAVRTGVESRAELTFTDQTITRLGENTVFSFNEGSRDLNLGSGAILVQVPPKAPAAQVRSAAFTCAVTGGTAMMESNPGAPHKVMVMEGHVRLCSVKFPDECQNLDRGQMIVLTPEGHLNKPNSFNVSTAYKTAHLLQDFPPLPNDPLIIDTIDAQEGTAAPSATPHGTTLDTVDQRDAAVPPTPPPGPSGTPGKFGPPGTIPSPNPYVINSSTQIQTDPSITTNGATDFGTIYRSEALDGPVPQFLYGSTDSFDPLVFEGGPSTDGPYAVFKFVSLQLTGDPIISIANGGVTNLALVSVGDMTSGAPGGTLTFAGMENVFLGTQAGSITLGSEISFSGLAKLVFYARGATSNLTLASQISASKIKLYAGGAIQVNGDETTTTFKAISGGDWLTGTGQIHTVDAEIDSLANINVNGDEFPDLSGSATLNAGLTLNLTITGEGNFSGTSFSATGKTINLLGDTNFSFNENVPASFTAGTGGIQGSEISIRGIFSQIDLSSDGDINIFSVTSTDGEEGDDLEGSITAQGALNAGGNIITGTVDVVGDITMGGFLHARDIQSEEGMIHVDDGIIATGGNIQAATDIYTAGSLEIHIDPVTDEWGNITAGGDITAGGGIFTPGDPTVVHAGGSISTPSVITGTLEAGADIHIDDSAGGLGIIANTVSAGGTLHMTDSPCISPNNGGSAEGYGETFNDLSITVGAISSTGPTFPVVSSNGGNADDITVLHPGNGGNITITITDAGLTVGDSQNLKAIAANGGDFGTDTSAGGNGGSIMINATDDVVIAGNEDGPAISATSGTVPDIFSTYGGNGGSVHVSTTGAITVSGSVLVSSNDLSNFFSIAPQEAAIPGRESANGGTIVLHSDLTSGQGITLASNGSLLSLLGFDAFNDDGSGGSITLSTLGADITVNGTIEADYGTITIDQVDPVMMTPLITIDGAYLSSATLDVFSIGDLNIAQTATTFLRFSDGTLHADHDVNWNLANTVLNESFNSIAVTGGHAVNLTPGNLDFASLNLFISASSSITAGDGGINASFVDIASSGSDLNMSTTGDISARSIDVLDNIVRGSVHADGAINITNQLRSGDISAGASITVGTDALVGSMSAGDFITVTGRLGAFGAISAENDISAGTLQVSSSGVTSNSGSIIVGEGGIHPFVVSPGGAAQENFITATAEGATVTSLGGIEFSGNQFGGIDGLTSGGRLTMNVATLTLASESGIVGFANFNGADAGATDNQNIVFATQGGDGGKFIVNASGDVSVGAAILATTGQNNPSTVETSGAGGDVEINSTTGTVTVSDQIEVSSAEPTSTVAPFRASSSGGNIKLTSGKDSGVAINVTSSGQLLALLSAAAPGPGGKVAIQATGTSSHVDVAGTVQADGGTVDIRHTGDSGQINLQGSDNPAVLRGDIVKVGALGNNGALNIGNSTISADTVLKLYAGGSNGTVNFIADVSLGGAGMKIIAGKTVNVFDGVTVMVGGANAANVYTDNPNYTGSGGNGSRTGTFGGAGATTSAFASAPAFDPGNQPHRSH